MIFSFYIYSQYLVMIIIPYIFTVFSTLDKQLTYPHPNKKKKKEKQWQPTWHPAQSVDFLCHLLCHFLLTTLCLPRITSDQMLQEQITWSKIPTSESNRYIFYKILIVDCTVPRFFQMSPTFWRVGAPGPQNWNSWLEHCTVYAFKQK